MSTEAIVHELHLKLTNCLNRVKLGVAGRVLYYDAELRVFTLGMHSTSPEKTAEASALAWDSITPELKAELRQASIGFAGKQI